MILITGASGMLAKRFYRKRAGRSPRSARCTVKGGGRERRPQMRGGASGLLGQAESAQRSARVTSAFVVCSPIPQLVELETICWTRARNPGSSTWC